MYIRERRARRWDVRRYASDRRAFARKRLKFGYRLLNLFRRRVYVPMNISADMHHPRRTSTKACASALSVVAVALITSKNPCGHSEPRPG